jgi:hypothetical protein
MCDQETSCDEVAKKKQAKPLGNACHKNQHSNLGQNKITTKFLKTRCYQSVSVTVYHLQKKPCKVNSSFSSSSSSSRSKEQEDFQPEPGRGRKRTSRALLQDYWNLCPIIHTPCSVSVRMSRDRFLPLLMTF